MDLLGPPYPPKEMKTSQLAATTHMRGATHIRKGRSIGIPKRLPPSAISRLGIPILGSIHPTAYHIAYPPNQNGQTQLIIGYKYNSVKTGGVTCLSRTCSPIVMRHDKPTKPNSNKRHHPLSHSTWGVNMLVYTLIIHEPCVHHNKKGGLPSRESRSDLPTSADPFLLLSGGPNGNKIINKK